MAAVVIRCGFFASAALRPKGTTGSLLHATINIATLKKIRYFIPYIT
jgi:hypothetical protein